MKINLSRNSTKGRLFTIAFLIILGLGTKNASAACKFVGLDGNGDIVYSVVIEPNFPVLMGFTAADSVTYQQDCSAWLATHQDEALYANYYFVIPWADFVRQSSVRQHAMKLQPDLFHIIPLDYQNPD